MHVWFQDESFDTYDTENKEMFHITEPLNFRFWYLEGREILIVIQKKSSLYKKKILK